MPRTTADVVRRHAKRASALAIVGALWLLARPAELAIDERRELAARFRFTEFELDAFREQGTATVRHVHPDFAHIDGWISSVGASVALADLDGDGLSNDVCLVDPRSDLVIVQPAPGTGERYAPFTLESYGLEYDRSTMAPMGCVPCDLNEDGRLDLVVYYWGRTPAAFLSSDLGGITAKSFVARDLVRTRERWFTNALTTVDVDGDGHLDLIVGNYFPDGSHVLDASDATPQTLHDSMSRAYNGGRNRVLRWVGEQERTGPDIAFEEVPLGLPEPLNTQWTLALGAADLDGDQLPELYVGNDFGPDQLLHNRSTPGHVEFALVRGERAWMQPRSKVVGRDSFKGMGVDFADLNGDCRFDIHVSNITTEFGLQESNLLFLSTGDTSAFQRGVAPYVERSEQYGVAHSGWAWDVRFADFDNDGVDEIAHATGFTRGDVDRWPELHEAAMGNDQLLHDPLFWHHFTAGDDLNGHDHNPFFVRSNGGRYFDLASDVGLGAPRVSRAIATGDVDGDGDIDFAVAGQWDRSSFFRNDAPAAGRSLVLRLVLQPAGWSDALRIESGEPRANEPSCPAIGATACVELPDGRRMLALVDGGNGHSGVRGPELHFGLGALDPATKLRVELRWRTRRGLPMREQVELAHGWHTIWLSNPRWQQP